MTDRYRRMDAESLADECARLEDELHSIRTSNSWRITAPLRSAVTMLRKLSRIAQSSADRNTDSVPGNLPVHGDGQTLDLSAMKSAIDALRREVDAASWKSHWLLGHRWHTARELSMGVAATYGYGIEGDIVEFGTMSGVSAEALARAIARNDADYKDARPEHLLPKKRLFLFDSFEGLPETDNPVDGESLHVREGTWTAGTCRGLSKSELAEVVSSHLSPDRFSILEGWFKDTVPLLPPEQKFGLIHVDGDLYSSTMDCLVPLFERGMVVEGALLYFDDWSPNRCSPDHGERRAWRELVDRFNVTYSDDGSYSLLARRFVVHSYRPGEGR